MRVGTVSPDGWPHVVPLWFVWHRGAIWVNNLRRSRRTRDLEAGSPVALCIDVGEEYGELRGAVLYGRPEKVPADDPDLDVVRQAFGDKYFGGVDAADRKSHDWLRMEPERIVSWDFRKIPAAGEGLEPVEGFDAAPGRDGWYTPWGGPPDTRSITEDGDTVYVNVHVGGILRSRDRGDTWEPTIDVDADVHKVWATRERVFAPCARGLAVSENQGDTWEMRTEGLHANYCRAVAVTGDTVLVSASDGPRGSRSAVYRGSAKAGALEPCSDFFDRNIDSAWLDATDELAAFGTEDGRVFVSTDEGATWSEIASALPSVHRVLVLP